MAAPCRFFFVLDCHLTVLLLVISLLVNYSHQDILGCGGFLKSQVSLDFSKVEIKLYTKQGTLKESSDCAPTNGYYFIPLYDKGEYLIKIEPPPGWSFEPEEVHLNFDGINDPCSKLNDINFVFKGFTINGKVISSGTTEGPKNVIVNLNSEPNESIRFSTLTDKNGDFQFTSILPNKYLITAHHENFKFIRNSVKFTIKDENLQLPLDSLVIAGYDVTGQVLFNNEPTKDVDFILTGNQEQNEHNKPGCAKKPLNNFNDEYLCVSQSDENGNFYFETLPPGNYSIKPYSLKFDVQPKEMNIVVKHGPVIITDKFLVKGFSISGKVMTSKSGSLVTNAEVYLNGAKVAVTNKDGKYNLNSLQSGMYVLSVKSENVKFEDLTIKVSPNTPEIETIYGSEFKVCGLVIPASAQNPSVVEIASQSEAGKIVEATVDFDTGKFCQFLKRGNYNLKVKISDSEKSMGMQYHPLVKEIQVKNGPSSDIEFTQLRGNVHGRIVKLPDTPDKTVFLTVKLKSKNSLISQKTLEGKSLSYTFEEVLPGQYDVEVENNDWCFKNQIHTISVISSKTTVPDFVQTGFKIQIFSSHETGALISTTPKEDFKKEFTLDKKNNIICLPLYTSYKLTPFGCHGFEKDLYIVNLKESGTLTLNAVSHDVTGFVRTSTLEADLAINVTLPSGEVVRLSSLKKEKDDYGAIYRFSYRTKENQVLKFVPTSRKLLFDPEVFEFRTKSECLIDAIQFDGEIGLIIEGSISPPLADVKVTLKTKGSDQIVFTKHDGKYKFGPLRRSTIFEVIAEKDSYVLSGPDQNGIFKAHKLAEIKVKVIDNLSEEPLNGVLLSLTGGEKFRKNSMTEEGGLFNFHNLSPGKYFLRPMMKEYKFEPSSQIIQIKEGMTESIEIRGRRVSFSAYGTITSLNGEPEPNVVVEAVGMSTCSNLQEEASSEANGIFRIRGLLPHCEYQIRLKNSPDVNLHIHRLAPPAIVVKTKEGDVRGIQLIAFQWMEQMDLSVHVESTVPEHLKTLRLKLCKEDLPDSPVYAVKLDTLAGGSKHWGNTAAQERFLKAGLLIQLPFIPRDKTSYFIQIESSLNKHTYEYKEPVIHFTADKTYKNFKIIFEPSLRTMDNEFSQRNYIIVPLLIFAGLFYTSFNKAVPFIQNFLGTLNQASFSFQKDERNFYINNINDSLSIEPVGLPTKRKSKPRKT